MSAPREDIRVISEMEADDASFDVTDAGAMWALRDAEERHFWHRTRNEWISDRLELLGVRPGSRVVDIGCGAGCVTAHLSRCGYELTGIEGQRRQLLVARARAPQARLWLHDLRRGVAEIPERDFDAAGLFDVLEHMDNPRELLSAAISLVRSGGLVVGTVPGLSKLWSEVDVIAGHKRRYEVGSLTQELRGVGGMVVVEVVPFNRLLVPLLWGQRRWVSKRNGAELSRANMAVPPEPLNWLLAKMLRWERGLSRRIDMSRVEGASIWFALRRT